MLQSKLFSKTEKNKSADAEATSHNLLTRAGFIDQLTAGVFTFLPLGFLVLKKIENLIREEMQSLGAQEILMPVLHPKENWLKTGRWQDLDILFKIKGAGDKEYALGPTHEEVVVPLAKKIIFSYRDLPLYVFQIQTKFRDELRVKSGILRTKEFLMKDLYSFHSTEKDLDDYYKKATKSYLKIIDNCGIYKKGKGQLTYQTLSSGGSFSKYSDEFQTLTEAGEDTIYICQKCSSALNKEIKSENPSCPNCKSDNFVEKKAIEVGNIFKLGTKYSLPFNLKFKDEKGEEKPVLMGCYGIGLARLMGAIVEVNNDEKGIIWPKSVAPFLFHLISLEESKNNDKVAEKLYNDLKKGKIDLLYDDRKNKSAGEKFAESDLLGIPFRIVVSDKTLKKNSVEVKERGSGKVKLVKIKQLTKLLKSC